MRLLSTLTLLCCLPLGAGCRCTPQDGWPHLEDQRWRVVLDPQGAHGYGEADAPPLVLMRRGDPHAAELLLAGYRGTARGQVTERQARWRGCERPSLPSGLRTAEPSASPEHPGIAWLGPATQVEIPTPPANPTELVQRAGQAVQDQLEPGERFTVRTLLKQRRPQAPPLLLVVGDAGCSGIAALLEADFTPITHDRITLPGPRCAPLAALPPADLDGDGLRELVLRAGNGEPGVGTLRAVYHLQVEPPGLERVWHSELTPRCPEG
jgi:hypothetical protein